MTPMSTNWNVMDKKRAKKNNIHTINAASHLILIKTLSIKWKRKQQWDWLKREKIVEKQNMA